MYILNNYLLLKMFNNKNLLFLLEIYIKISTILNIIKFLKIILFLYILFFFIVYTYIIFNILEKLKQTIKN